MSIAQEIPNRFSAPPVAGIGSQPATGRRSRDDMFFSAMAILMLGIVFLGFARTYFLAGVYHTHVRSVLIQVHGAVFTTWLLLLITQTALVTRRQIAIHRKLGVFGAFLIIAMVGLGITAATDSMARGFTPPGFPLGSLVFYAVPMITILTFAVLAGTAISMRSNSAAHKRLILLATITLMGPAVARWPFAIFIRAPFLVTLVLDLLVLLLAAFDLSTLGRIHRATLWAGLSLMVSQHLLIPVGMTPAWRSFAAFALRVWQGKP